MEDFPVNVLDYEENVKRVEREGLHTEEVAGPYVRRMKLQKCSPTHRRPSIVACCSMPYSQKIETAAKSEALRRPRRGQVTSQIRTSFKYPTGTAVRSVCASAISGNSGLGETPLRALPDRSNPTASRAFR